jgi:RNA polymerase sigma-70 factor (ECF subfamily)
MMGQPTDSNNNTPSTQGFAEPDSDRILWERVKAGNNAALAQLYDCHAAQMLGLANLILQDRDLAEDLVHDVFIEAWQRASTYQPQRSSVRTWLLMRVRSRAIDRMRMLATARNYAQAHANTEEEVSGIGVDPSAVRDRFQVCRALMILPETQRIVVALGYFEGLSCQEIASRCDIPIGTVKSRLAAALNKLRAELNPSEPID